MRCGAVDISGSTADAAGEIDAHDRLPDLSRSVAAKRRGPSGAPLCGLPCEVARPDGDDPHAHEAPSAAAQ